MGKIVQLDTRPARLRQDQADALRQALLPFADDLPSEPMRSLIAHIARQTASRSRWTFVMLSPNQNAAVVNFLASRSTRPLVALRLWALCFEHLDTETGEIMLTRDEIAERMSSTSDHISEIMTELVDFGAISRRRVKVAGMRGQGVVRYFMNPRVATNLAGQARDEAQKSAPLLRLIEKDK
jgi:hypothetical protein